MAAEVDSASEESDRTTAKCDLKTNDSSSVVRAPSTGSGVAGSNPAQGSYKWHVFCFFVFLFCFYTKVGMPELTSLMIISLFKICLVTFHFPNLHTDKNLPNIAIYHKASSLGGH